MLDTGATPALLNSHVRGYSHFLSINNTTGLQFATGPFTSYAFTSAVPAEGRWHSVPVTAKRNDPLGIK